MTKFNGLGQCSNIISPVCVSLQGFVFEVLAVVWLTDMLPLLNYGTVQNAIKKLVKPSSLHNL